MSTTPAVTDDFDGPWKEALETYLEDFFAFFFPAIHVEIDWSQTPEFLDKEFGQIAPAADIGKRLVDKLVKVWSHEGEDAWVLVHVEVQNAREADFAQRMYVYNYRIFDRFARDVASLAVLSDTSASWRPTTYRRERWGTRLEFSYPIVKLHDYRKERAALEGERNPFATVVLAHLGAQDTRHDPPTRRTVKMALTRRLYGRGYDREQVVTLFRLIDWLLELPEAQEALFRDEITALEEERKMVYVTSIERMGIARGREEGRVEGQVEGRVEGQVEGKRDALRQGVRQIVERRFGVVPEALEQRIAPLDDVEELNALLVQAAVAASLEDIVG